METRSDDIQRTEFCETLVENIDRDKAAFRWLRADEQRFVRELETSREELERLRRKLDAAEVVQAVGGAAGGIAGSAAAAAATVEIPIPQAQIREQESRIRALESELGKIRADIKDKEMLTAEDQEHFVRQRCWEVVGRRDVLNRV